MENLHLLDIEGNEMTEVTDLVDNLTVPQALEHHAKLRLKTDAVLAERDRARLKEQGGRRPVRTVCIPPSAFNRLKEIAISKSLGVLQALLDIGRTTLTVPIVLKPCLLTTTLRKTVAKGGTVSITMDTLVNGKDVTVTALDANDSVLSDPTPVTVTGSNITTNTAQVDMIVPSGYGDNKIKFKIDKKVVDLDEFGTHPAVSDDSEVHTVTVT